MGITVKNGQQETTDSFSAGMEISRAEAWQRSAFCLLLAIISVLVMTPSPATATPPLAGSQLENRATASFRDDTLDLYIRLVSNPVNTTVLPQEALTLTSDQNRNLSPGAPVTLSHRLTNTGNAVSTYTIALAQTADSNFTLTGLSLYQDLNSNGLVENSDRPIAPGSSLTLQPGESAGLMIFGTIPWTTPINRTTSLTIEVKSFLQGLSAVNTDRVVATTSAIISLIKKSSSQSPKQGEAVTYTLMGTNNGENNASPISSVNNNPITIDGAPVQTILVRDLIPANTGYVKGSLSSQSGARLLYHRSGDPQFAYLTAEPQTVDEVACEVSSLEVTATVQLSFKAMVNQNASGIVNNTAYAHYNNGDTDGNRIANSNNTELQIPQIPPSIKYYTDSSFNRETGVTSINSPLFLQADAAQCNSDPLVAEVRTIYIKSDLTGDEETFSALETGVNTGLFRILPNVPMQNGRLNPVIHGNGIVEALKDDKLTARIDGCGTSSATTEIFIDPMGIVFDSRSNEPVAGAIVTLYDVTGNGRTDANKSVPGKADVFAYDTVTPLPSTVVTGIDGKFEFPLVRTSDYRIDVIPPAGYSFISLEPPHLLPANRNVDAINSYHGTFSVNSSTGGIRVDIPVDPIPLVGLFIEKRASASVAEIGDFINYTVQIKNGSGRQISGLILEDQLPAGFSYQTGSARLDGATVADPTGKSGPRLTFSIGVLPVDKTAVLNYRVKLGVLAMHGDGINRAQAKASHGTVSNVSTAHVKVLGGVFSDKGHIIGKIFVDCNRNRIQDPEELGIPGVRIYIEDGSFVISDSEGKYSLYGLRPRTHVMVIDDTTLPSGSELIDLSNRNAGDAASRFIDLKNSELHKANFAEGSCSEDILRQVKERRAKGQVFVAESEQRLSGRLSLDLVPAPPSEPKALPASGLIGGDAMISKLQPHLETAVKKDGTTAPSGREPVPAELKAVQLELEQRVASVDSTVAILEPQDGAVLSINQTNIVVKGRDGGVLKLTVNGREIPDKQVGKKIVDNERHLEAREYIGINLKPGENELKLEFLDHFANSRGSSLVKVIAPDLLARIVITVPEGDIASDGHTPVKVQVRLTDDKGVPVTSRTYLTLESSLGRWQTADFNETEPGVQTAIEGGSGEFLLLAPQEPGNATIRITSAGIKADSVITFIPELRPMIAVGLIEGIINVRKSGLIGLSPTRSQDGFDQELESFSKTGNDGKVQAGSREALFLKGKIKGDYLLTLAYDSNKETQERLFRDIQPDEFYPVYGDSSIRGFEAQSTGKLYVRIDKNRSYLLFGDFTTSQPLEARSLGAYNRSMTGLKYHLENRYVSANVFGSQDSMKQVIEELPAMGISGPYYLQNGAMTVNSEQVEIITRDRNQPSLILNRVTQTRFTDYEIEQFTGRIIFKSPVPSLDPNLNPNLIRVTYELDQGGRKFLVAGADGQLKLSDKWEIGGGIVQDSNPTDRLTLMSANTTFKLNDKSFLTAEMAQSDRDSTGKGEAARVELRHEAGSLKVLAKAVITATTFDNPNSATGKGRREASANADYRLSSSTLIKGEILHSEDRTTGGVRDGAMVNLEKNLADNAKLEFGLRKSHETTAAAQSGSSGATPTDLTSARVKLSSPAPFLPNLSGYGEYEQALDASNRKVAALGTDYKVAEKSRIYARHQFISSLTGSYGLNGSQQQNATLFGIDSEYMADGHAFSEYRIRDAINSRDSEAAIGLRNGWTVARGVRLSTGLERIQTLNGTADNTATAITGSLDYSASPLWKLSSRGETRLATAGNSYLGTLGAAWKLNRNITLLSRDIYAMTDNKGKTGNKVQNRLQTGMAYRPVDNDTWNILAKYEYKTEDDKSVAGISIDRSVHIFSGHLNYQPLKTLQLNGVYAAKFVNEFTDNLASDSRTSMLGARVMYDLRERWDMGVCASTLFGGLFRSNSYGLGIEVGHMMAANLWLSGGYNFFGYNDQDLTAEEYTNQGVYIRFRYKFDQDLFAGDDGAYNKTIVPVTAEKNSPSAGK